jgi:lipoprotein-releasing system permease protein
MYRYFLALRYLLSRPINLIAMAGVMVSVWAMILVVSIFSGFLEEVRAHIHAATADLTVICAGGPVSYAEIEPLLRSDPNVAACAPRVIWYGLLHAFGKSAEVLPALRPLHKPGAETPLVSLIGIDPAAEMQVTGLGEWLDRVERGDLRVDDPRHPLRTPAAGPEGTRLPGILLSEQRLRDEFVGKGAVVKITSARLANAAGGQNLTWLDQEFAVAGAYATRHHEFDGTNCFVDIDHLRPMMDSAAADPVTEVVVRCKDPAANAETAERLRRKLEAEGPESRFFVGTWQRLNEQFLSAVDHQRSLMKLVLFVIMVVAAFLMYATLSMMVTEKTHDIGILTAMGATSRGVMQVFVSCGFAVQLLGAVLGAVAGCISSVYLDDLNKWLRATFQVDLFPTTIYNLERVPYDLDPLWIAQVVSVAMVVGVVVAGLPAWRAARFDPLQALRNE